jgi:hypothetical protein
MMGQQIMRFQLTAIGLACATLLSACGGGGGEAGPRTLQTIDFKSPGTQTLPSGPKALTATASSNLPVTFTSNTPTICTVVDGKLIPVMKGECSITATQAGDPTYQPATSLQLFTILQAAKQEITFTSPGKQIINDTPPALLATSTSGLAVSLTSKTTTICTVSGTTLTLLSKGECEIVANQGGNNDYPAAAEQSVKFVIADGPPPATFASGYQSSGSHTLDAGFIDTYASDPTTKTVAADGSTFTFSMTKQSAVPNFGGFYGVRFLAPGLDRLVADADTTAGVRINGQTTMKFKIMMNPEMLTASKTKLRVWLYLGHYHKKADNSGCNVTLEREYTPTFSAPGVMQEQSLDLADFFLANRCDAVDLVAATELANYPISKIEFNVLDINNSLPNAGTTIYTTSMTMGKITFK